MRKGLFVILSCIVMVSFHLSYAADIKGNGKVETRKINVTDFDKIEFGPNMNYSGSIKDIFNSSSKKGVVMYYTQKSGAAELEITTDENIFSSLKVDVSNGKLTIHVEKGNKISPSQFVVKASSSALTYLKTSGSVDVVVDSDLKGNKLECEISGASDVSLKNKVDYSDVKVRVSGSGDLIADNFNCKSIEATVSGSGDIKLKGKAETGNFRVSGSGDIKVHVKETLSATASGSGDLRYKGNPTVNSKVSGSGSIKKAN